MLGSIVVALIALLGVGVVLYPSAASWFSELDQRGTLNSYTQHVEDLRQSSPEMIDELFADAQRHNAENDGSRTIRDPFTFSAEDPELQDAAVEEYLNQLRLQPDEVMAQLRIPKIDADLPIYHGTSDATLQKGIGHLFGSSLPVGGVGTHSILTGHRGYSESSFLTRIDELVVGDMFSIVVLGRQLDYMVDKIYVIDPRDTETLVPIPGRDLVSLIACTPIGVNTHRIVVEGSRVDLLDPPTGSDSSATPDASDSQSPTHAEIPFPWWAVFGGGALVALGAFIVIPIVRDRRWARRIAAASPIAEGDSTGSGG